MKKYLSIVLVFVVFSLLVGCGDNVKTWRVTKSTGLYDGVDVDSKWLEDLSAGTKVKDISERDYLSQCFTDEVGIVTCRVIVVATGQEGFVIKKWLD